MGLFSPLFKSAESTVTIESYTANRVFDNFAKIKTRSFLSRLLADAIANVENVGTRQHIVSEYPSVLFSDLTLSSGAMGLIDVLAELMCEKSTGKYVYFPELKILRKLTSHEVIKIQDIPNNQAKSKALTMINGSGAKFVELNLSNFDIAPLLVQLFTLTANALDLTYRDMTVARSIIVKIKNMMQSVSVFDQEVPTKQAREIIAGIKSGDSVVTDSENMIESYKPDITQISHTKNAVSEEVASLLSLSKSYVDGVLTAGVFSEGLGDRALCDGGFEAIFHRVLKPALMTTLGVETRYIRMVDPSMELYKSLSMLLNADALLEVPVKKKLLESLLIKSFPGVMS